jgi:hypothetical protein
MPIIVYTEKIVFIEKNASKKREMTQLKCWIELSSLFNRSSALVLHLIPLRDLGGNLLIK